MTKRLKRQRLRREPKIVTFPATAASAINGPLVPRKTVQEMLKVCAKTLRRWEIAGKLTPIRVTDDSHSVYYRSSEIQALAGE